MCGRYALSVVMVDFAKDFGVQGPPPAVSVADRYNIAPTQPVLIVRENRETGSGRRELAHVVWGLIPPWAENPSIGSKMINARAETVTEKPAFRNAFKRRRCLIPTTGFYEWQNAPDDDLLTAASGIGGGTKKRPWYFRMREGRPFGLAGLWETWAGPDGELLESCSILTTRANELVASVHDRMPVIVARRDYDLWLNPEAQDPREVQPLLRSFDATQMEAWPVDPLVNNARNEGPRLIERRG